MLFVVSAYRVTFSEQSLSFPLAVSIYLLCVTSVDVVAAICDADVSVSTSTRWDGENCEHKSAWRWAENQRSVAVDDRHSAGIYEHKPRRFHWLCRVCIFMCCLHAFYQFYVQKIPRALLLHYLSLVVVKWN